MEPRAFIGSAAGATVYLVDDGFTDGAAAFDAGPIEPLPVAPAGADGEAVYHELRLALTHTMACTVRLTPIVEGIEKDAIDIVLEAQAARTERIFELALSEGFIDPMSGVEEMRTALRGAWFTVRVETVGGVAAGDLIFNGIVVTTEVVSESRSAENAA